MTTICLVRHGETDWNVAERLQGMTDIPLNDRGIRQAQACANYLKDAAWDVIVTSPLQRARKTADIINQSLQVPLTELDECKERSFGDAEGMTIEKKNQKYKDAPIPNQEDRATFRKRVLSGISKINQRYHGQKVLLVAHGAVIGTILREFTTSEMNAGHTKLLNACISNIAFHSNQWEVRNFNQVDHLSE
ncbi:phosphatase YhfR [Gracilibacillus halophilus YIM-C55.5]|uniref:Phosphatase YhfR n=1 Tax=Gracilibacillus halophilus YIM-C55.5 TaxID=1308866 RepID=N4W783_9BACI|nr:histidine phosphatase family protein [Gracilibacillus halophilus]ENH96093.1 phosphatase YhfR [Gracilibacillus halophilus YIM-C55.5]